MIACDFKNPYRNRRVNGTESQETICESVPAMGMRALYFTAASQSACLKPGRTLSSVIRMGRSSAACHFFDGIKIAIRRWTAYLRGRASKNVQLIGKWCTSTPLPIKLCIFTCPEALQLRCLRSPYLRVCLPHPPCCNDPVRRENVQLIGKRCTRE